jgi:uncharacterized membrane protein AbrB (regulator of aidB expression)
VLGVAFTAVKLPTGWLIAGMVGAAAIAILFRRRYVALSQYLRLTIVVLTMPLVLSHLGTSDPMPHLVRAHDSWHWQGLLALAALVLAGGCRAKLARMPAPYLLGPLVVASVLAIANEVHSGPIVLTCRCYGW